MKLKKMFIFSGNYVLSGVNIDIFLYLIMFNIIYFSVILLIILLSRRENLYNKDFGLPGEEKIQVSEVIYDKI